MSTRCYDPDAMRRDAEWSLHRRLDELDRRCCKRGCFACEPERFPYRSKAEADEAEGLAVYDRERAS